MVLPELSPHERRVREMMVLFGQAVPDTPSIPPQETRCLRARLLLEEVLEYIAAAGLAVHLETERGPVAITMSSLQIVPQGSPDLVAMTDALADISVVTTGAFAAQGTRMAPVLECVDANNLMKVSRGRLDASGKFIKAADHPPPDLAPVLGLQGWKGT